MSSKKKSVISQASPHTIKKFELIEEYIKSWAEKLLLTGSCNGLIFIDCMCNSGVYIDDAGQVVKGTAVRVSEVLWEMARTYTDNNIHKPYDEAWLLSVHGNCRSHWVYESGKHHDHQYHHEEAGIRCAASGRHDQ